MEYEIKVHDPTYTLEAALKEMASTLYKNVTAVPYNDEYGTRIVVTMGDKVLQIIIPPDYKEHTVHIQMAYKKEAQPDEN